MLPIEGKGVMKFNRHMRRAMLALGIMGMVASQAFAWQNDEYYVKQWQGNVPGNATAPMLQVPNGGGNDGDSICVNQYYLHSGQVVTCGACLVQADHGSRTFMPEIGLLKGYSVGVIKLVISTPNRDGSCDPTRLSNDRDAHHHALPELCDGYQSNACAQLVPTEANDPKEYLDLEEGCADVKQFSQARCMDP